MITFVWHQDFFSDGRDRFFKLDEYFDDLLVPLDLERSHREILIGTFG